MKRDCDSPDRIEFREEANRGARTFLLVVIALFGTLCFLGFFDRLSRSGPEAWVYAGIVLPGFRFNKAFVEALEAKSGIPVERLPDQET